MTLVSKRLDESWVTRAKCQVEGVDPNYFYPKPSDDNLSEEEEKKSVEALQALRAEYCHGLVDGKVCPEKASCLEFALSTNQSYGVWGGTTEKERVRLRRRRNQRVA